MKGSAKMSPKKADRKDLFHVINKVPTGDGPYVRAKHAQIVDKDPEAAIVLFWKAINAGDRIDSALKDMAVVMKQQDRAEEAIEAIKSFRDRCSKQAQESLDNVLIDLYKKCGMLEEQIELLKRKLWLINQGEVFNGKATKTARSHGKKFQVSVKQETSRILGNLGWAYMQQIHYVAAEAVYRKAQMIDPDANKACNLSLCLTKQGRNEEARSILEDVLDGLIPGSDDSKSKNRALQLVSEINSLQLVSELESPQAQVASDLEEVIIQRLDLLMNEWTPFRSKRLPIFEEISPFRDQMTC
ncbi:protein SULFUR DEFICIENCY-INDUCED 1-like isoform X2 [Aristolochia californica]|uniref:protein SULFUR DEFICIENCY-INDUCED 1-like isoform X2 n=1 Tax=Aristolochia californica TaxID=171875 RepID=UPI0035E1648E